MVWWLTPLVPALREVESRWVMIGQREEYEAGRDRSRGFSLRTCRGYLIQSKDFVEVRTSG